jgi:hypothetical protein
VVLESTCNSSTWKSKAGRLWVQASLGHTASTRPASATYWDPIPVVAQVAECLPWVQTWVLPQIKTNFPIPKVYVYHRTTYNYIKQNKNKRDFWHLSTLDIWGWIILCCLAVLRKKHLSLYPLASFSNISVVTIWQSKCLWTLLHIPSGPNYSWLRTTKREEKRQECA